MISDSEISRRLHELADSGGPWDDPLPAVRRSIAAPPVDVDATVLELPLPGGRPDLSEPDEDWNAPVSDRDRRRFAWKVPAAAAAVVLVLGGIVGLARLLPQGDSAEKSSASAAAGQAPAGSGLSGTSAAAGGSAGSPPTTTSERTSHAGPPVAVPTRYAGFTCSPVARRVGTLKLRQVPDRVLGGTAANVTAQVTVSVAEPRPDIEVYVVGARTDAVIGALRAHQALSAAATGGPASYALVGRLGRWSCSDGNAPSHSTLPAPALPPGSYRLVAVLLPRGSAPAQISAPVPVRIVGTTINPGS